MKSKKIIITLVAMIFTLNLAVADELTAALLSKRKIRTIPIEPKTPVEYVLSNPAKTTEIIDEESNETVDSIKENILEVFKPYEKRPGEVILGSTKNSINAIDPTSWNNKSGAGFPGGRGANQLVIYSPDFGERTNTNEFGSEAVVVGNIVTEMTGADSYIPKDGVVISGHGRAKSWINSAISVGTKIYIDKENKFIYTYTTSDSFIFESEKKIAEAEALLKYYKSQGFEYNWKLPQSYIDDACEYLKKAKKNPQEVQKYSQLAIDSANEALKSVLPYYSNELKGIWVRPVETSENQIIESLNKIQKAGIDNIFLETYFHGKTIFPSKIMEGYGFVPQYETFIGIDPLKIWITEAHKRGIKVHIWFETFYVGNDNPESNPKSILAINPDWANRTKKDINSEYLSRSTSEHSGYFLDPANPYVQDFLAKLVEEIITEYKPDGINIDYIRYPNSVGSRDSSDWGYTEFARNDFMMIYGVDPAELSKSDLKDWNDYRIEQVTNMVKKFGQIGKKTNTYISAVIFPDRQAALNSKFQDWKTWSTRGYLNGITPLFLTCDSRTAKKMMSDVINAKSYNTDFYAGLFVTFMGGSDEDLIRQIHEARQVNAKGVILFDFAHLNDKYINTLSKSVFLSKTEIKQQIKQESQRKGWKTLFH